MEYYNMPKESSQMSNREILEDLKIKYDGLLKIMKCSGKHVGSKQWLDDRQLKGLPFTQSTSGHVAQKENQVIRSDNYICSTDITTRESSDYTDHQQSCVHADSAVNEASVFRSNCSGCAEYEKENQRLKESVSYMIGWAQDILQMLNHVTQLDMLKSRPHADNNDTSNVDFDNDSKRCAELESQFKKVAEINMQWQAYSEGMEREKEELRRKNEELEQQRKTIEAKFRADQQQMKQHLESQRKMIDTLKQKEQAYSLQQSSFVSAMNFDRSSLHRRTEFSSLMEALKAAHDEATAKQEELENFRKEAEERIRMLQLQLLQYREDFNKERQDRTRAHSRANEYKQQLQSMQSRSASMITPGTLRQISQNVEEMSRPSFIRDETDEPLQGRTELLNPSTRPPVKNNTADDEEINLSLDSNHSTD